MQTVTIEVTDEEYKRWTALPEERQAVPQWAFIRALNYSWRLSQQGRPMDWRAFDSWPPTD